MVAYNIEFKPSVHKDFRHLPKAITTKILKEIDSLRNTPISIRSVKISGAEKIYRIRVGDYRIIYEVDKNNNLIIVHYIRHRKEVYRHIS